MLVLGAGRGHDARLFARRGFTVTAVDFSSAVVEERGFSLGPREYPVDSVAGRILAAGCCWNEPI
jgi:hypothetical protein